MIPKKGAPPITRSNLAKGPVKPTPKPVQKAPAPKAPPPKQVAAASAQKKPTALATRPKDTALVDKDQMNSLLMEDQGAGQESMTREDFAIPRLAILQALSPQVDKRNTAQYVEGAEAGMIFNSITIQLYDGEEGFVFVPVSYRRAYIEWKTREAGGGFVRDHGSDATVLQTTEKDEKGRDITPEGNDIVTTAEYFGFVVHEDGSTERVLISMSRTQLKKARKWNTIINQLEIERPDGKGTFNPAMFYRSYKLSTVPENNDQGSWMGWKIEPYENTLELPNGQQIYLAARNFRASISAGEVQVAAPNAPETPSAGDQTAF